MAWIVAVSNFNAETTACDALVSQGFACYFPKFREKSKVRGRRVWLEKPLYGRYFFVKLVERWNEIFYTRGVSEILMSSPENPSIVKDEVIDEIKHREINGFVKIPVPSRLRHGQNVRITIGPFTGRIGVYVGMGRRDREIALLELMGMKTRVEVAPGGLAPV